jgi:hypothetical protein
MLNSENLVSGRLAERLLSSLLGVPIDDGMERLP